MAVQVQVGTTRCASCGSPSRGAKLCAYCENGAARPATPEPAAPVPMELPVGPDGLIAQVTGKNGHLCLWPGRVSITRTGSWGRFRGGEQNQELLLPSLILITLRKAAIPGLRVIHLAARAPATGCSVFYSAKQHPEFVAFKRAVEGQRDAVCTRGALADHGSTGSGVSMDKLNHLTSMRDNGLITEDEYCAQIKVSFGL